MAGRPRKSIADQRTKEIKIMVTGAEHAAINDAAKGAGMPVARFLRESAIKTQVVNRHDWRSLVYELNRIGNNINQIAAWANKHKTAAEAAQITVALMRLERTVRGQVITWSAGEAADAVEQELPAP